RDHALRRLDEAWESLAPWNTLNRRLAIEASLEAGDATRIAAWVEQTRLPEGEGEVFLAWGVLLEGDVMEALRLLAALPQTNPRVGYLQALALVEQGRWAEAQPWITRTETLLPGRVEIEVARARTEVRLGNALTALGKLTALAEFEPYAPRAWTGLGEAHLLQKEPDLDEAERVLQRAVEREPVPADALLLLANVAMLRDPKGPKARLAALRLLERATEANARLPKFGEALALHLAELGLLVRAREALEHGLDRPGAGAAIPLALAGVLTRELDPQLETIDALLQRAEDRSAPEGVLAVARAQLLLLQGDEDALTQADRVIVAQLGRQPTDVVAHSLRVRILLARRDIAGAETALRRGLAAVEAGNKGRLYFEWARLESKTGRRKTAAPRSRRAWVELLTEQREAWVLLDAADLSVRMWLRSKMERVATTIAHQLTDRLSYHSRAWTIRARAQLAAGEAGDACKSADKAVALDAEDPQAHEVRGDCLLRFGSRDKAKASYERAVSLAKGTSAEAGFRKHLRRL
ncbi:MAG: tetratricopeptide repeat protein, partial [Nannocystaceae bacterium]|nr:tetratricopeptide repeat protein [Nannocystaceae bacterium]